MSANQKKYPFEFKKFVLDAANPFIVPIANWPGESVKSADEPLRTVTSYPKGGAFSIVIPTLVQTGYGGGGRAGQAPRVPSLDQPLGTVVAGEVKHAIAEAHLVKFRFADEGKALNEPLSTITSGGNYKRPAGAAHAMRVSTVLMTQMNGGFNTTSAKSIEDPMTTVTNTGSQQ